MTQPVLTVVRSSLPLPAAGPGEVVVTDDMVRNWVRTGEVVGHVGRYRTARLVTERLATAGRPMLAWVLRLASTGRCYIADTEGAEREISLPLLVRWSSQLARETVSRGTLLRAAERDVAALAAAPSRQRPFSSGGTVLYLRSDLSFGVRAGGSVGHIAGVLNALAARGEAPIFVTTADVPTLARDVEVHRVPVSEAFWNFQELPTLVLNTSIVDEALRAVGNRQVSLVYQRYSLNNYSGLSLARRLGVPFVVEYNGSEVWMARHWGRPLKYEALASRIEMLNTTAADLVVVVSRAMRDELVARGVAASKILVNPNAVDPVRYSPDIDGSAVRTRLGLQRAATVVGFISTFQPWHGADVLADAFVRMMRERPDFRSSVRLLMVGTGPGLARTREIIDQAGLTDAVRFAGLVPQEEGAAYLAAADVLVSPHVPNPDGTPFFGSPTKLFEYMAIGRGIVASNLDQIGEVLRDDETALLVAPGDAGALSAAMMRLVDDRALRDRLGHAARAEVLAHHTWDAHVARAPDALPERAAAA